MSALKVTQTSRLTNSATQAGLSEFSMATVQFQMTFIPLSP